MWNFDALLYQVIDRQAMYPKINPEVAQLQSD